MKIDTEKYKKKHPLITRLLRAVKYYFLLFVRKEDSPQNIAHGLAMGVFVGFLPIIPFQTLIILLVCTIFKTNKLAGVIGSTTLTNPITAMPVFYAQHFLGRIFILHEFSYEKFKNLFVHISVSNFNEVGKEILILFEMVTIGGIIVGVIFYPFIYYITLNSVIKRRERISHTKKKKRSLLK
ncbi:MAG: DUF2062 domain-containing protein [Candidatus Delongbacteria bacterium]|nr:DUF2062 domain-containing protein [Candidatus Delongbacteria bacterium]